ncbi:MAG: GAF domain-containing protein, partial [Planctomycetota bacterium]
MADFIRQNRDRIIAEWEAAVRSLLPSGLDRPTLLDHVPELLLRIADRLERPGDSPNAVEDVTETHAIARLDVGTDLRVVVCEYLELRRVILRMWEQEAGAQGLEGEVEHVNLTLDEAMLESVSRFTKTHRRTLEALDRLSVFGIDSPNLEAFFPKLLGAFREHAEAVDVAAIFLLEKDSLRLRASVGLTEAFSGPLKIGEGFVGRVAAARHPLELTLTDPGADEMPCNSGTKGVYGVPLVHRDELVGVTFMGSKTAPQFSQADQQLLRVLANRATTLIVQHQLVEAERAARAEAEKTTALLATRERFLKSVIDSSPDCIKVLDLDGRILSISKAGKKQLEICDVEPLVGTSWIDFWEGDEREL